MFAKRIELLGGMSLKEAEDRGLMDVDEPQPEVCPSCQSKSLKIYMERLSDGECEFWFECDVCKKKWFLEELLTE